MNSVSFTDGLIHTRSVPIHFIVCRDSKNQLAHYFVMCSHQKLKMLKAVTDGILDLKKYGPIIASGFGREPPLQTLQMLRQEYDYDYEKLQ